MKITIYTINDCQFSKQEKEYLNANNLAYEEKNLESNREFLTEMLTVSNNFAGTPVTKIEKDDGQIAVLKGFTKEEFDKALDLTTPKVTVVESSVTPPIPPVATQTETPETPPPVTPLPPVTEPISQPVPEPIPPTISSAPVTPDPLNAVLNDLQQKAETPTT